MFTEKWPWKTCADMPTDECPTPFAASHAPRPCTRNATWIGDVPLRSAFATICTDSCRSPCQSLKIYAGNGRAPLGSYAASLPANPDISSDGPTCEIQALLEVVLSVNLYVPPDAQLKAKYTVFANVYPAPTWQNPDLNLARSSA